MSFCSGVDSVETEVSSKNSAVKSQKYRQNNM